MQTDTEGQTLTFQYDALNRLTHKTHAGATLAEYGYDQGQNGIGQRTAMTDTSTALGASTSGSTQWAYDAQGRVVQETKAIAGVGTFDAAWTYDAAGRVVTTTYPTGEAVRTTYNLRGLPTSVTGLDPYLTGADYDAAGQPLRQTWGNTRQTSYTYEPDTLRLQQLQVSGGLLDLDYGYDDVGNILSITDGSNAGQIQTFTYDARDRLLTARTNAVGQGQYAETHAYDWMGNVITRTVNGAAQSYVYGRPPEPTHPITPTFPHLVYFPLIARNHDPSVSGVRQPFAVVRVTGAEGDRFHAAYDLDGNMTLRVEVSGTERITYTQAWDVENRLSVVTNTVSGEVTRFVYDGDGNRVLREDAGGVTAYFNAMEVHITGTQRVTKTYYFAGGQRIAMREGGEVTYLHGDHLGSASLATDAAGGVVNAMRYTPYGVGRSGDMPTDRRFTDQRWESGLGLYDYGARFYSPSLGRFVSADIIVPSPGNPQSLNRYSYVLGNPLVYTDPGGRFPWLIIPVLVVAALVLTGDVAQPPLTVSYEDTVTGVSASTNVPAIALAAGVQIQAPGNWDDFASTFYKCNFRDCNPSVGISQIKPHEVEGFTGNVSDRREVVGRLRSDNDFSIQMMHAKLADARERFEVVCREARLTPSTTDYFIMYALAQNGLRSDQMELAMTADKRWEKLLETDDKAAEWNVHLMHGSGYMRWFVRDFVKWLRTLQEYGYELPDDVDLDRMERLGGNP